MNPSVVFAILCLLLVSCVPEDQLKQDIALIGTIENKLLPSVMVEGEVVDGFTIHERMAHYKVPGVSMAFLNRGEIVWAKGYGYTSFDSAWIWRICL